MRLQTKTGRGWQVAAILWFALVTASPAGAWEPSAVPPDLARALVAYNEATAHSDTRRLSALVTDDYVLVNSDASVQGKTSYLADFAVPGFKVDPYEFDEPLYKVSGDGALTAGLVDLHWTQDGRHQTRRLRMAHFWVRQQGHWRIAYTQLTRLPE
jgi:ketosteroid isomerase-like protein